MIPINLFGFDDTYEGFQEDKMIRPMQESNVPR